MKLNTCRFYCCGDTIHFSFFSDAVCRACYQESIAVLFGDSRIDVYAIEPSPCARWVVIMQKEREQIRCRWFLRKGDEFIECASPDVPKMVTVEILHKFPHLADQLNKGSLEECVLLPSVSRRKKRSREIQHTERFLVLI